MKEEKEKRKPTLAGWKIIFRYILQYKREVLILSALGVMSALANASVPYLVGRFLDSLIKPGQIFFAGFYFPLWMVILIVWGIIQIIANTADWINDLKSRRLGTHISAEYPARGAARLLTLPLAYLKENKYGEVWDKIDRGAGSLSQIVEQVVIRLTPQFLAVFVGLFFAFSINTYLATVLIFGIFAYIFVLFKILPPVTLQILEGREAWSKAWGTAWDAIANFQTVKQSSAEVFEKNKIHEKFLGKAYTSWYKVEKIWATVSFSQRIIVLLTQLIIFISSAFLVNGGSLSIGQLVALNGYAAVIFGPFVTLGYNWQVVQNGVVAIERAEEILQTPPENIGAENKKKLKDIAGKVEFKHVHFSYKEGDVEVLKGINFTVEPGQVVALVGESGVGKSTTMELVSGYYFPQNGAVLVDGHDTKEVDLYTLRRHIAIVPQETVLFNDTIETNIRYGKPEATTDEVHEAARKAHANLFIDEFPEKYNQLVGERGIKLSVGQKQRIALARAMLRNPSILILDEPTSALDAKTEKFIEDSLQKLMKGRTTFIIAHRLSTVRRADKILVFEKGKIVEEGTHEELVAKKGGVYEKLYRLHVGLV
jgi:ATP-binding cassette subfamily B protein